MIQFEHDSCLAIDSNLSLGYNGSTKEMKTISNGIDSKVTSVRLKKVRTKWWTHNEMNFLL
jgi:hypothetical protein